MDSLFDSFVFDLKKALDTHRFPNKAIDRLFSSESDIHPSCNGAWLVRTIMQAMYWLQLPSMEQLTPDSRPAGQRKPAALSVLLSEKQAGVWRLQRKDCQPGSRVAHRALPYHLPMGVWLRHLHGYCAQQRTLQLPYILAHSSTIPKHCLESSARQLAADASSQAGAALHQQ